MDSIAPRDSNRARVFEVIHLYEPVSRTEIASQVGLTSAAVSYIVSELLELGVITELGRRPGMRGQPAIELGVKAQAAYTLGLHFEHSGVSGVIVDLKGNIAERADMKLPPLPTPDHALNALIATGKALLTKAPRSNLLGVGLATVGPIDLQAGSVTETPFTTDWHNVPLRQPLAEALQLPVFMDNNATAAAIGEYWYGAGRNYPNFLCINFSDIGLGGGLFLNQRVYRGSALNAAEFGHMLVHPRQHSSAPPFLESYASGFALQRDLGPDIIAELESRLASGDKALDSWLAQASQLFAQALVSVDHLLDLDAIIVDGQLPAVFLNELVNRIDAERDALYMPGWTHRASLQLGQTGKDCAVLGAATLPLYDAFIPVQTTGIADSLFKSEAVGGVT